MAHGASIEQAPTDEQLAKLFAEPKALISVYDKTGIEAFANSLHELGIGIVSTGSTANVIRAAGVPVTEVSEITGVAEMLGGRVKTLHPKVHGGVLANTKKASDVATLLELQIPYFKLICVDMYPFETEVKREGATPEEINEQIDIGGPSMLRGAAKARRIVLSNASQRQVVIDWLKAGSPDEEAFLDNLAAQAFYETARYDFEVAKYMGGDEVGGIVAKVHSRVKYGENAYQKPAALYADNRVDVDPLGLDQFEYLESLEEGAEKWQQSYNGLTDLDRLLQTTAHIAAGFARNFGEVPCIAVGVKHGNACGGAAVGKDLVEVTKRMIDGDTRAIFGGVVMVNGIIDKDVADALMHYANAEGGDRLLDGIIGAGFTDDARHILSRAKLRLIQNPALAHLSDKTLDDSRLIRPVRGGHLEQPNYTYIQDLAHEQMEFLGEPLSDQEKRDMILAWGIGTTSNTNTITIVKNGMLLGNGVGQQDRVGAAQLALSRTSIRIPNLEPDNDHMTMTIRLDKAKLTGAVAYSDGFFSHVDSPTILADAGITAIMTSFNTGRHKKILEPLIDRGIKFAMMPEDLARGFYNH